MEISGDLCGFVLVKSAVVELDKVLSHPVLKPVDGILTLSYFLSKLRIKLLIKSS